MKLASDLQEIVAKKKAAVLQSMSGPELEKADLTSKDLITQLRQPSLSS